MNDINVAHESATRCSKIQVIQELFVFQPVENYLQLIF